MRNFVGIAALLLVLTGCGDGGSDSTEEPPPTCAALVGQTIPEDFEGCTGARELETVSGSYDCVDGRHLYVVRDEVGWAFEGEEWNTGSGEDALFECYGGDPPDEPTPGASESATEEPTDEPTDGSTDGATDGETDGETDGATGDPTGSIGVIDSDQCDEIWVVGATLAADYIGCKKGNNEQPAAVISCNDGSKLTAYDDRFFAFLGEEIQSKDDEQAYEDAFTACFG